MALSIKRGVQHLLHCIAFIAIIFVWIYVGTGLSSIDDSILNPWESYGWIQTVSLYICRSLVLLSLPVALFNFLGLVLFPAFPDKKITVKVIYKSITFSATTFFYIFSFIEVCKWNSVHLLSSGHERWLPAIGAWKYTEKRTDLPWSRTY